ncbi:MAG: VWA domain-containing protein [Anaerolineae bacterium]|nr:VWA domain-containing protein [Anaerolineae bacterium]
MGRYLKVWAVILLLLLGSLLPAPVVGQRSGSLDLLLLIDSTGSTADTDPEALRTGAAEFLLDYVQAVGEATGMTHRFAAANFNTETLDEIPWTMLQGDAGRTQLLARSIGNTDFGPALDYALSLRQEAGGAETLAIVVFTDGAPCPSGEPCPQGAALEAYFQDLEAPVAALREAGAELFVVALGDNTTAAQWQALIGAGNYRFVDANTDLAGVYHDFLAGLMDLGTEAVRPLNDRETTNVVVEPYLEHLVLSAVKATPNVKVTVTDPFGGTPLPTLGGDDSLHAIYALPSPTAGAWRIAVTGGGAQVWVDRQYATLALDAPSAPQALGAPLAVSGQLLRRGNVIADDPDLRLSVTATGPNQDETTFDLTRRTDGRYLGTLAGLTSEGNYTLTLNGEWAGQPVGARQVETVTLGLYAVPFMVDPEIEGELLVGEAVTVTVTITHADRIGPETEAFIRLLRVDGSTVATPALRDDGRAPDVTAGDGIFFATLIVPKTEGRYRLEGVLQGKSRDGVTLETVTAQQMLEIRGNIPTPTVMPTLTPPSILEEDLERLQEDYRRLQNVFWGSLVLVLVGVLSIGYLGSRISTHRGRWKKAEMDLVSAREELVIETTRANAEKIRADREQQRADDEKARAEEAENTFIKKAEKSYRRGKSYLSKGQHEKARQAFAEYFEILAQGLKEFEDAVMPTLSLAAIGLFETLIHLPKDECDRTLLDQARLTLTPELDKVRFNKMADVLPELWQPEQAGGNLYALLAAGGRCEPLLSAIAAAGRTPLGPVAQTLQQAIDNPTPETLHRVVMDAKKLPLNSGIGLAAVHAWLESLAQHTEPPCLPAQDVEPVLAALRQSGPEALTKIIETAAETLTAAPRRKKPNENESDRWQRVLDYLENGLAATRSQASAQLPEVQILFKLVHRWLLYTRNQLEKTMSSPEIHVDLYPALSQSLREEELKDGYWRVDVPVNVFNVGQRSALDVAVTLRVNYGRLIFFPNSMQRVIESEELQNLEISPVGIRERCVQNLSILAGGQAEHLSFRVEAADGANCRLQIDVTYREEQWDPTRGSFKSIQRQCASDYLEIAPPLSLAPKLPKSNPYTTGPLLNDSDWTRMGKAHAPETVQQIVSTLEDLHTAGRFIHIVGLRRTGKTTILKRVLRLAEKLEATPGVPKFLCVYLDLDKWLGDIDSYRPQISADSAFWYAVLAQIFSVCEGDLPGALRDQISHVLQIDRRSGVDSISPSKPELPIREFKSVLRSITRATHRELCLALDEGEVLADLQPDLDYEGTIRDLPESSPITRIMSELQNLVEDQRVVVLLARGYNELVWEQDVVHTMKRHTGGHFDTWHTSFLTYDETLNLVANTGGFLITELGKKTLWQLTGGYPLLVQVLADHLYKQRAHDKLPPVISNGLLKRALFDLMTTSTGAEALDFMRYGFKREEEMVLKVLAVWFTDSVTGYLHEVGYGGDAYSGLRPVLERMNSRWPNIELDSQWLAQIIDRFMMKKLLEEENFRLRWQVGWLCLLMREVFIEESVEQRAVKSDSLLPEVLE